MKEENITKEIVSRLLSLFQTIDRRIYYENKLCVPRKMMREVMHWAHDNRTASRFAFKKSLRRLYHVLSKAKKSDVEAYCAGCLTYQQQKDGRTKSYGDPQHISFPEMRCGSVVMDFITHLPTGESRLNSITTVVDMYSRRSNFIVAKDTDTVT